MGDRKWDEKRRKLRGSGQEGRQPNNIYFRKREQIKWRGKKIKARKKKHKKIPQNLR